VTQVRFVPQGGGGNMHGPELETSKSFAQVADALLPEQNRPF